MKIIVTRNIFVDAFKAARPDNFTDDALDALFIYLDEADDSDDYELDVIALCADFTEYTDAQALERFAQGGMDDEHVQSLRESLQAEGDFSMATGQALEEFVDVMQGHDAFIARPTPDDSWLMRGE